ncbi:MAG TPA: M56 family metallopeptidase [Thermoanaerobaculia bacterium]
MTFEAVVAALLRSSLQGALFIGAVWLACRLFPRLPAAVRCGLWWAACLKLLVGLVWIAPVELPLLPAVPDSTAVFQRTVSGAAGALTSPALLSQPPSRPPGEEGEQQGKLVSSGRAVDVAMPILLLWLAGLTWQSAKALRQLRHTRRVIVRSRPLQEGWIRTAFAELCALLGLRRQPGLRGSADVRTPQAIGPLRPLVLLPESGLERLSPAEVSMTLCHELIHLRRGDLWLGWVPALAHRIFFFHPLAALAAREYAIAREAACDAEVLRVLGSAPQAYGRLLLRWGVAPRETGLAAAGASPSLQNLKRRLQMLQQTSELTAKSERRLSGWWWLAGAAVLVALIPLRIVAQEPAPEAAAEAAPVVAEAAAPAEPAVAAEAAEPQTEAIPAAVAEGIPGGVEGGVVGGVEGAIAGGVVGGVQGGVVGGVQGGVVGGVQGGVIGGVRGMPVPGAGRPVLAPAPGSAAIAMALPPGGPVVPGRPALAPVGRGPLPAVAAAPGYPAPLASPKKSGYSYSFHSGDKGDSWVLLYGDHSATMSGSMGSLEKAKRLRGNSSEPFLWYRRDGREYVVRDPAVLRQAQEIFRPQMELGARQGELGARQGALGAQQGALGAKQGELGGRQGALGVQQAALAAEQVGREGDDRDLDRRQEALEAQMEELGRQQAELGRQQEALGRQQEELGRQQEELGRQQEAASKKAEQELRALMDQAIRSGAAQPAQP